MLAFDFVERFRQRDLVVERIVLVPDDAAEILDPAHPLVAGVPHQAEPPTRSQHPRDLLDGALGIEPVPGLRDQHRVHAVVGQRNVFCGTEQRRRIGQRIGQQLKHFRDGIDRDDVEPALDEPGGELSRPCAEVEHVSGVRRQQPVDGLGRIGRSAAFVRRGLSTERQGTLLPGSGHLDASSNVSRIRTPTASDSTRNPSWP